LVPLRLYAKLSAEWEVDSRYFDVQVETSRLQLVKQKARQLRINGLDVFMTAGASSSALVYAPVTDTLLISYRFIFD
jgi:hypothetical protein